MASLERLEGARPIVEFVAEVIQQSAVFAGFLGH
jgi:hypothetical protein